MDPTLPIPGSPPPEPAARPAHPPRGTKLWPPEISGSTRLADLFVPRLDRTWHDSAHVERRMLMELLDPARWPDHVSGHVAITGIVGAPAPAVGGSGGAIPQATPVHYIMYDPTARVRIISGQTFRWTLEHGVPSDLAAVGDPDTGIFAIPVDADLTGYPWRSPARLDGELRIRLCDGMGFDEDPTGTRQYWPGRDLEPAGDYLPYRFMVKSTYAWYAILQALKSG